MWVLFTGACLACLLALYGPGCLLFRGLRFSWPLALACAPLASVFGYAAISVLWGMLGIDCSWATTALPVAFAYAACLLGASFFGLRDRAPKSSGFTWGMLALYLSAGLLVCSYVYVLSLDGPQSYYCRYDNQTHYNLARHFLESGDWSVLHADSGAAANEVQTGYYPAAWHLLVALVASATGIDMPIVTNALNTVLGGVAYPLSSFVLMHTLFPARRDVLFFGAFTSVGFACLPWVLLLKGQLLANLLSFALVPAAIALVIAYVHAGARCHWRGLLVCSALSVGFFGVAHPNGLFTVLVFLVPFIIHRIAGAARRSSRLGSRNPLRKPWIVWILGLAFAYLVWQAMLYAPPLQQVVLFNNTGNLNLSWTESAYAAAVFSLYPEQPPQWALTLACAAGLVALVRQRRFWLGLPALYMLVVYSLCRCSDAPYTLRTFLAGFWYSDPYRILCCAELFLVPIAAFGLATVAAYTRRRVDRLSPKGSLALIASIFVLANFLPFYQEPSDDKSSKATGRHFVPAAGTAIGYMHYLTESGYNEDEEQVYSAEEQRFVRKVLDTIPHDALVVNQPHDGSVFAYGLDGLNTYFRHIDTAGTAEQSRTIRDRLNAISNDPSVQEAVRGSGARYVLLLDQNVPYDDGVWLIQTGEDYAMGWQGLASLTDETPGFKVILAEGDMRLYEIADSDSVKDDQ